MMLLPQTFFLPDSQVSCLGWGPENHLWISLILISNLVLLSVSRSEIICFSPSPLLLFWSKLGLPGWQQLPPDWTVCIILLSSSNPEWRGQSDLFKWVWWGQTPLLKILSLVHLIAYRMKSIALWWMKSIVHGLHCLDSPLPSLTSSHPVSDLPDPTHLAKLSVKEGAAPFLL